MLYSVGCHLFKLLSLGLSFVPSYELFDVSTFFRFLLFLVAAQIIDHHSAGGSGLLSPLTASGFFSVMKEYSQSFDATYKL